MLKESSTLGAEQQKRQPVTTVKKPAYYEMVHRTFYYGGFSYEHTIIVK
jgi:hypothetical protein